MLNDDIWRLVFVALHHDAGHQFQEGEVEAPLRVVETLRLVCRDWRRIIETTPELWQYVVVNAVAPSRKTPLDGLAATLMRSGVLQIQLSLILDTPFEDHADAYFTTISHHTNRLLSLWIVSRGFHCLLQHHPIQMLPRDLRIPLIGLPFPKLKTLRLENIFLRSCDILLLFFVHSPALEVLKIKGLDLPDYRNGHVPDHRWPEFFSESLTGSPLLAHAIYLPALHTMEVDYIWICRLFTHVLRAPALRTVSFYGNPSPPPMHANEAVERFAFMHRVTYLCLTGRDCDNIGLRLLLMGSSPHLRRLRLNHYEGVTVFVTVLCGRISERRSPVPVLGHVEIIGDDLDDSGARLLLGLSYATREGSSPIRVDISGCENTTTALGREITKQDRGTWARKPLLPYPSRRTDRPTHCDEHMPDNYTLGSDWFRFTRQNAQIHNA